MPLQRGSIVSELSDEILVLIFKQIRDSPTLPHREDYLPLLSVCRRWKVSFFTPCRITLTSTFSDAYNSHYARVREHLRP
jgi:hypothetical protein